MLALKREKILLLSIQSLSWQTVLCAYQFFSVIIISIIINSLYLNLNTVLHVKGVTVIAIMGSYFSLSYIIQLLSGYISGRWLPYRYMMLSSVILLFAGNYYLSLESIRFFYIGAMFVLLGGGLSLTTYNIICNSMSKTAAERRCIFIKNCLVLSVAIFVGEALIGYFQASYSFHNLYLILIVTLLGCLLCLSSLWKTLIEFDRRQDFFNHPFYLVFRFILALLICSELIVSLLRHQIYCGFPLFLLLIATAIYILRKTRLEGLSYYARIRLSLFLILLVCIILLQSMEFLQPMIMMHFLKFNVDRHWFHWVIPSTWVDDIRGVICITLFAIILFDQKKSRPYFSLSLSRKLIIKACYWFVVAVAMMIFGLLRAKLSQPVELIWIVLYDIACGVAEVLISLQCYLIVGNLVPDAYQGPAMGMVCCLYGLSSWIAMKISLFVLDNGIASSLGGIEFRWLVVNIILLLTWFVIILLLSCRSLRKIRF